MRNFMSTFTAGETKKINFSGDFIKIQSAAYPLNVALRSNKPGTKTVNGTMRAGQWFKATSVFDHVEITSDYNQETEIIVAYGDMGDSSVAGVVQISGEVNTRESGAQYMFSQYSNSALQTDHVHYAYIFNNPASDKIIEVTGFQVHHTQLVGNDDDKINSYLSFVVEPSFGGANQPPFGNNDKAIPMDGRKYDPANIANGGFTPEAVAYVQADSFSGFYDVIGTLDALISEQAIYPRAHPVTEFIPKGQFILEPDQMLYYAANNTSAGVKVASFNVTITWRELDA